MNKISMKISLLLFISFGFGLIGCKPKEPMACLEINKDTVFIAENLKITNCSEGYDFIEYDFKDGNHSQETDPIHQYTNPGTYEISQSAINKHGDKSFLTRSVVVREYRFKEIRVYNSEGGHMSKSVVLKVNDEGSGDLGYVTSSSLIGAQLRFRPSYRLNQNNTKITLTLLTLFGTWGDVTFDFEVNPYLYDSDLTEDLKYYIEIPTEEVTMEIQYELI